MNFAGKAKGRVWKTTEKTIEKTIEKTTKKTTKKIFKALEKYPDLTTKELADICGISIGGINYQLKKMKNLGMIRRIGPDKGGHWEIIK